MKKKRLIFMAAAFVAAIALWAARPAPAQDQGNELTRKKNRAQEYKPPEEPRPKEFDTTMQVYLDTTKVHYKPGELPVVVVYLWNNSKETRFFKRLWSTGGAGGVFFRSYFDDVETLGVGIFSRAPTGAETENPEKAVRLGPGEKKEILRLKFIRIADGVHKLRVEYDAKYTVAEKTPRNWWNGLSTSNTLSFKVTKNLPQKKVAAALDSVIKTIHNDLMGMKDRHPALSGYGEKSLKKPAGAYAGASTIDYQLSKPKRVDIRIYFNRSDYQPNTTALLSEGFPFLDVNLFAHIDVGGDTRLRAAVIDTVRKRSKALNSFVREVETSLDVDVEPFEEVVSAEFARAEIIFKGKILSAEVERNKQYDYQLKKWELKIKVLEVYKGEIKTGTVIAKCGTLNLVFGDEKIVGKEYIIMTLNKHGWQKEYAVIGAETPRENLISWLKRKFKPEK